MEDFYEAQMREFEGIDRGFTFAGVEFKLKPVMPGDVQADLHMVGSENSDENAWDIGVSIIRRMLRPEYRARWDAVLMEEREIPITLKMIYSLIGGIGEQDKALVEDATERPTTPPVPSTSTGGKTGMNSTEGSASKEEVASAISRSVPA